MGFQLVPKLVTLNDLKRQQLFCVISPNTVTLGQLSQSGWR